MMQAVVFFNNRLRELNCRFLLADGGAALAAAA